MITDNQTTDAIDGVDVELGMMNQTEENPIVAPVVDAPAPMSGFQVASNIGKLIFSKENRVNVIAALLLSGVNTGVNFLAPLELGAIVQRFPDKNYSSEEFWHQLGILVSAYALAQLIPQAIAMLLAQPTTNITKKVLIDCMDHQLKKSLNFYLREPTSEHTNVIQKGFMVGGIGLPSLMQLTPTLIQLGLADIYFFVKYGTEMGSSIIALLAVSLAYNVVTGILVQIASAKNMETGNKVNESMMEMIKCYQTMRDFCHYDYTINQFNQIVSKWAPTNRDSLVITAQAAMGQVIIVHAHMLWVAWYVGSRVHSGQYNTQDFIVAIGYLQLLSALLPAFSQSFLMSFIMLYPNASFIFSALNEPDEVVDLYPDIPFPAIDGQAPTIEFDQMSFDYPPRPNERTRKVAFDNLSCQIGSGERVAIVTESGVGKSTLFNLLFGYYLPSKGTIKINGQDITQMSLQALQRNITIFAQTPGLLNGSIRENIAYGAENPDDVTDDMIWQLARETNLEVFLKKFEQKLDACDLIKLKDNNIPVAPKGVDDLLQADFGVIYVKNKLFSVERLINNKQIITELNPVTRTQEQHDLLIRSFDNMNHDERRAAVPEELQLIIPVTARGPLDTEVGDNGKTLSGGQKQKIALLRGLLKKSPIWLLDEVTASLDATSAQEILATLRNASHGITTIMSNHKLSEVKQYADRIIVINDRGMIVGHGTHQELLVDCPLYAQLWRKCIEQDITDPLQARASSTGMFSSAMRRTESSESKEDVVASSIRLTRGSDEED